MCIYMSICIPHTCTSVHLEKTECCFSYKLMSDCRSSCGPTLIISVYYNDSDKSAEAACATCGWAAARMSQSRLVLSPAASVFIHESSRAAHAAPLPPCICTETRSVNVLYPLYLIISYTLSGSSRAPLECV